MIRERESVIKQVKYKLNYVNYIFNENRLCNTREEEDNSLTGLTEVKEISRVFTSYLNQRIILI